MADLITITRLQLEEELREARQGAWDAGYAAAILDIGQMDEPATPNPFYPKPTSAK